MLNNKMQNEYKRFSNVLIFSEIMFADHDICDQLSLERDENNTISDQ